MSNFPLYNLLLREVYENDYTEPSPTLLVKKLRDLPLEHHEIVFMLIRYYYLNLPESDVFSLPFNALQEKDNMTFFIENIPLTLRKILWAFIRKYSLTG